MRTMRTRDAAREIERFVSLLDHAYRDEQSRDADISRTPTTGRRA